MKIPRHLSARETAMVVLSAPMKLPADSPSSPSGLRPPDGAVPGGDAEWAADKDLAITAATPDRAGREAFVEIVRRHQTAVCAVAWSVTGRLGMTDDIAQETFFKAWKKIATLRDPAKLKAWLTRIAHDCAVDALRREKPHSTLHDPASVPGCAAVECCSSASPDKAAADAEEEALVWSALAAMPENLRMPLVLFYREGQSVAAVAAAMDLSEDAVRQRLSRGRQALRAAVESRIESVLGRVQPSALLIVTIAAGIGLLAKPAALAAGVTAAAASAAGASATTASASAGTAAASTASAANAAAGAAALSTFMTTTTWLAAAITLAAFLPLGWKAGGLNGASGTDQPAKVLTGPVTGADPFAAWPDSPLLAEWRRLHETHGSNAAAMPALYGAIQSQPDKFRRDSLNMALMAEWAATDPEGAFQLLWSEKKNPAHAALMMREWLKRDPDHATEHLLANLSGADSLVTAVMIDIAELAPDQFAAILSSLPEPIAEKYRSPMTPPGVEAAINQFARQNLAAAQDMLALLKGPVLSSARVCVASLMAEKDPASALARVESEIPEDSRKSARIAVLGIWAEKDPASALTHLGSLPDAREYAEKVLGKAAEKDLAGALQLWRDRPEILGNYTTGYALQRGINRAFEENPLATIQLLAAQPGENQKWIGTESPMEAMGRFSGLSRESADAVWDWIGKQKPEGLADQIGNGMLVSDFYTDPAAAIARLKSLPEAWQARLCTTVDGMANIRQVTSVIGSGEFEGMLAGVAPAARGPLLASFFGKTDPDSLPDAALWRPRLDELPEAAQPYAAKWFTSSLASMDPLEAQAFVESLPAGPSRKAAWSGLLGPWVSQDSMAASAWLNTLPPSGDRESAAAALVKELPFQDADAALTWAATISNDELRLQSLTGFAKKTAGSNPDQIPSLLESPLIRDTDRAALRQALAK